jgi:hypothetical protein
MATLLHARTLIQKNFWLGLMLVSLSFTFLGAGQVTIEVIDRSERTANFDARFHDWCAIKEKTLPTRFYPYFQQLSRSEKELLFLSSR